MLRDIAVSVGRTGRTTPFAVLEPVFVGGSTVQMATLHNEDQVRAKDVRPGDTVIVRKAGDVIPEVVGPVISLRPDGLAPWQFPTHCPCPLHTELVRAEGEADTRCVEPACPFQRDQRIIYFASRGAMDIEGLGERTVFQLSDAGLVGDPADIYALTAEQLLGLDGFAKISADKLLAAIAGSKERPLPRLLTALGIKGLGPSASDALARRFGSLDNILAANEAALATTDGVGPTIAGSIVRWYAIEANRRFVDKLRGPASTSVGWRSATSPPRSPGGPSWSPARWPAGRARRPRRRSRTVVARARAASAPRRTPSWSATIPGRASSPRPQTLGVPILDEDAFDQLLETGELPELPEQHAD